MDELDVEPFESIDDIPTIVRAQLPPEAQQIWFEAYNAAASVPGVKKWQAEDAAWKAIDGAGFAPPADKWVKVGSLRGGGMNRFEQAIKDTAKAEGADLRQASEYERIAGDVTRQFPFLYDEYLREERRGGKPLAAGEIRRGATEWVMNRLRRAQLIRRANEGMTANEALSQALLEEDWFRALCEAYGPV